MPASADKHHPESAPAPSPAFIELFRAHAGTSERLPFDQFMALALYDPQIGYYRQSRERVGKAGTTDFFTASTMGAVFGELICAAATSLLARHNLSPANHCFVEIGAEPGRSILDGVAHPFASVQTLRVGEPLQIFGPCVVFSNELFDAQPFRRFVFQNDRWAELGVALTTDAATSNPTLSEVVFTNSILPDCLPAAAPEGWHLDLPLKATELARQIAAQPWTGLFLACDYGKSWRELIEATPAGTARAYHRHRQSNNLLALPGEQDLTCHVCWDWLCEVLSETSFAEPKVESQESFCIRHAETFLSAAFAEMAGDSPARINPRKHAIMQLLHPAHMGQKFQVLHACRAKLAG